jgi:putative transposase
VIAATVQAGAACRMTRRARIAPGGYVLHVLNRANGFATIFDSPAEYRDFLRIVDECAELEAMRVLAYCAMPNHWHLLVWPRHDGDLRRFVHRLTVRHTKRWHERHGTGGRGHLYQARYKSFLVQDDVHLLTVCRYIERNPLRARLVRSAFDWRWSSANDRLTIEAGRKAGRLISVRRPLVRLDSLPVELPESWSDWVDAGETEEQLLVLRRSVREDRPFGAGLWQANVADEFDLALEPKARGRRPKA